jgi:hypothetical protein
LAVVGGVHAAEELDGGLVVKGAYVIGEVLLVAVDLEAGVGYGSASGSLPEVQAAVFT